MLPHSDYRHQFELGEALFKLQKLEEALSAYQKSVFMDSTFWQGHLKAGMVLMQKLDYSKALISLKQAQRLAPNEYEINYSLAHAYAHLKDRDAALQSLDRARAIRKPSPQETRFLSEVFFRNGLREDSFVLLKQAIAHNPKDHESLFWMGVLVHLTGDLAKARTYYKRAIAIEPSFPSYQVAWAMARIAQGQSDGIKNALSQFSRHDLVSSYNKFRDLHGAKELEALLETNVILEE
jgi:tetratricopeptide (TPR) repeat protein